MKTLLAGANAVNLEKAVAYRDASEAPITGPSRGIPLLPVLPS